MDDAGATTHPGVRECTTNDRLEVVLTRADTHADEQARDMVDDERELLGAVPLSEVVSARNEIMVVVRGLMDQGEFNPARAGEELVS